MNSKIVEFNKLMLYNPTKGEITMKKLWVLSIRTSLPDECLTKAYLKTTFSAFETFEDAKKGMREEIKKLAFSKNAMFDGNGKIIALDSYIADLDDYEDEGFLSKNILLKIQDSLFAMLNGEDTVLDIEEGEYEDGMIAFDFDGESLVSYGVDDGPCNGYDPYIATNAFSMEEERDYYLYIDDLLGQDYSSELYIDLKQVEVK